MTSQYRRLLSLCLVVFGLAAATTVGVAGQTPAVDSRTPGVDPQVNATLDGSPIADGGFRVVESDPELAVTAAAGPGAADNVTVRNVIVRVDGRTVRGYRYDSRTATASVDLPLSDGNNSVRVIVEDSADRVTSRTFTVGKDDTPPWIGLTSPYATAVTGVIPDGRVDRTNVTLGVRVDEFSDIRRGSISLQYENGSVSGSQSIRIDDPPYTFERELLLGPGNNTVRILMIDELGNRRLQQFVLTVNDTEAPDVSLGLLPNQTSSPAVQLNGAVTDNVWVRNVSVRVRHLDASNVTGLTNRTIRVVDDEEYRYSDENRRIPLDERVPLREGTNRITVFATDHRNRNVTREFTVERVETRSEPVNEPPRITIDRERTRIRADGRLQLVARVEDDNFNLDVIAVETERNDTGALLDFERFTDIGSRAVVSVNTSLRTGDGNALVRLRAVDDAGERHLVRVGLSANDSTVFPDPERVDTPAANESTGGAGSSTATETPTPAPTPPPAANATGNATATPSPTPTVVGATPTIDSTPVNVNTSSGGLPFVGSLPTIPFLDTVVGFLVDGAPFAIGAAIVGALGYFLLRRRAGGEESESGS